MAKKKKQYPKQGRNIVIGLLITLAVVAVSIIGVYAKVRYDNNEKSYIGTINGQKVSIGEFKMNLFDQQLSYEDSYGSDVWSYSLTEDGTYSFIDYVKDAAYSSTMYVKASAMKAREYGADYLTDEQSGTIDSLVETLHMQYGDAVLNYIGLSDDELRAFFTENYYAENLYQKLTDENYVLNEEEFDAAFETYYEENINYMKTYVINYIITKDNESIQEAVEKYENGAQFMDLVAEYSYAYTPPEEAEDADSEESKEDNEKDEDKKNEEENEDLTVDLEGTDMSNEDLVWDLSDLTADYNEFVIYGNELEGEMADAVFALSKGEISEIIPLWDDEHTAIIDYLVLYLKDVSEPNKEYEREEYMTSYISEAKSAYYEELFQSWINEMDIAINEKGFNSVTIYGY